MYNNVWLIQPASEKMRGMEWRMEYMTLLMRDQEMIEKGKKEEKLNLLITFFTNGGSEKEAQRLLGVTEEEIRAAQEILAQKQEAKTTRHE